MSTCSTGDEWNYAARAAFRKVKLMVNCLIIFLFLTGLSNAEDGKSFYDDHARGWHWYEPEAQPDDFNTNQESKDSSISAQYPATEELKLYQAQLEEAKAAAVMYPTSQNVFNYQKMQYEIIQKSGEFAKVWMQNVYKTPDIDYTQESPMSQNARHIYLAEQKRLAEEKIHELSQKYGLFFFFKNNCPYCDAFAPVVKGFSEKYDWDVLAISEFGETHELFERSVRDNGLAETWGVNTYPSLFAVNPKSGHVIPVAIGMISIQEMEERIVSIMGDGELQ
ncbi:MAG: conjugal transfer protein TraF [Holosporaceae bacterium]|jgi:conjugal transfer pilus assembly protein TraF|nr:conjugal transfer protein TraF [Holosporaceae bacterium]